MKTRQKMKLFKASHAFFTSNSCKQILKATRFKYGLGLSKTEVPEIITSDMLAYIEF